MVLIKSLLSSALRKAAADPRARAKAAELFEQEVKPRARSAAKASGEQWRDVSREVDPYDQPARFAGRLAGRLKNKITGND